MNKAGIIAVLLLFACSDNTNYVPKQHGFPRMTLPVKKYHYFDSMGLPYAFEIPQYALMEKDTNGNLTREKTWFNLNFKPFNATLHITYYKFNNWSFFDSLVYDTRKLVNKHIQKADDITEEAISNYNNGVSGILFKIEGNTATNLNFYLTDSMHHFFRGALYFNDKTQQDSIAPVFQFVQDDVIHLVNTFKWK